MADRRCADCIHFAPWPERVELTRNYFKAVLDGYPLYACMHCPTKALAVAPDDGGDCRYFESGDRDRYIKEACDGA